MVRQRLQGTVVLCAGILIWAAMLTVASYSPSFVEVDPTAVDPTAVGFAKIDVNVADTKTLMTVPGIGVVLAQRIADYREEYGRLLYLEELQQVRGIGSATYALIAAYLTVF